MIHYILEICKTSDTTLSPSLSQRAFLSQIASLVNSFAIGFSQTEYWSFQAIQCRCGHRDTLHQSSWNPAHSQTVKIKTRSKTLKNQWYDESIYLQTGTHILFWSVNVLEYLLFSQRVFLKHSPSSWSATKADSIEVSTLRHSSFRITLFDCLVTGISRRSLKLNVSFAESSPSSPPSTKEYG